MPDISPERRGWRERELSPEQVQRGVQALTTQILQAIETGRLEGSSPTRYIYTGVNIDGRIGLFPLSTHPWANNRAVAEAVVAACRQRGFDAEVQEPRWVPVRCIWRSVGFAIYLPDELEVVTHI